MEQLLQRPQDPDLEIGGQPPALHFACVESCIEATRLLLEAGADKDRACVNHGLTPMLCAYGGGCMEVVHLLLEANADKDKARNDGTIPLFMASQEGHLEVVRLLLETNADKDMAANNGATPLVVASHNSHLEIVRLLLEARADNVSSRLQQQANDFQVAVGYGH